MNLHIMSVTVQYERDVVSARQRARQVAGLLGFDPQDQTRIATAVSEVARNAYTYAGGGRVEFGIEGRTSPQVFITTVSDQGRGIDDLESILSGRYRSPTGMGVGLLGSKRLMDAFDIKTSGSGTVVRLRKILPSRTAVLTPESLRPLVAQLAAERPRDALAEVQQQNQELLRALEELRRKQDDLTRVNRELEDTNRGVVALYAELEERADHLRRVDEVKTRFLSNMTHEFRTPVNSILALADLLIERTDGDLTVEQERQVGFIRKAGQALSELVNDLLDLAKVEAGKIVVRPSEFEVAGLFGALRGMLRPLLVSQSVSLVFDDPADIPSLETDESKVSQILRNLISNSLKFTERGEVRVKAVMNVSAGRVEFSVSDTGIGIAPEDIDRIFQEFGQLENPIQRRVKGTGLGLPLSRRLAELLGGSLSVRSELGVGSVFTLSIPAQYAGKAQSTEPPRPPAMTPDLIPVLAIDDQPADRLIYDRLLRGTAFQAVPAVNLRQARDLLLQTSPGAILLDVMLGNQDAWRFLAELKSHPGTSRIPVLMVTSIEDQPKAYSLGADAYGVKPLNKEWLIGELRRLTSRKTALIVDDDETARYTLRQMLRSAGWDAVEAGDGTEGLRLAAFAPVRVVFLDLMMPGISGLDVLREMRARPGLEHMPVLVSSSATVDPGRQKEIERLGGHVFPKSLLSPSSVAAALRVVEERDGPGGTTDGVRQITTR